MDDKPWSELLLSLNIKNGGVGLRQAAHIHNVAYTASLVTALRSFEEMGDFKILELFKNLDNNNNHNNNHIFNDIDNNNIINLNNDYDDFDCINNNININNTNNNNSNNNATNNNINNDNNNNSNNNNNNIISNDDIIDNAINNNTEVPLFPLYSPNENYADILNFVKDRKPIEEGGVKVSNRRTLIEFLKVNQSVEITQKKLTITIDNELQKRILFLLAEQPKYTSYQAWIRSNMSDQHSGSWLRHASFNTDGTGTYHTLSQLEFKDNLKLRLGCQIFPDSNPRKCDCLEDLTFMVDENHFHGISCPKGATYRSSNHSKLNQLLQKFMVDVTDANIGNGECNFSEEELIPKDKRPNNVDLRADTRVYFNGTVRFIDVGVTAPSTKTMKHIAATTKYAASES
jgi:hypothetical protein